MKKFVSRIGVVLFFAVAPLAVQAQGTAFSHQGFLTDAGESANGVFDLQFTPYDAATAGTALAASNVVSAIPISNGLFTVTLDFGISVFNGSARWLETSVRSNGAASFTALSPRQPLLPAPYAIYARGVVASGIVGTIKSGQLDADVQTNLSARLSSNVWATTDATTNYVRRTGDTMTGTLNFNITTPVQYAINIQSTYSIGSWITLQNTSAGGTAYDFISTGSANGEGPGNLLFRRAGTVPMLIYSNGNIGMDTLTPNAKLHVVGNQIVSGVVTAAAFVGSAGGLTIGTTQLVVTASGNVGVGTALPYTTLTVTGSIGMAEGTTPVIYLNQAGNILSGRMVVAHSVNFPAWGLFYEDSGSSADSFHFQQNSANPVLSIGLGSRNVGIGTNLPLARLHVVGNEIVSGVVTATAFSGSGAQLTGLSGGMLAAGTVSNTHLASAVQADISARLDSNTWALVDATTNYVRRTGDTMTGRLNLPAGGLVVATTHLNVNTNGNVGIGTASPFNLLEVRTPADGRGLVMSGPNGGSWSTLKTTGGGNPYLWDFSGDTNGFAILRSGIDASFFASYGSGFVSVGTGSPNARLHVFGNEIVSGVVTAAAFVGSAGGLTIGTTQLVVTAAGKVGIGTTTPVQNLQVVGNAVFTGGAAGSADPGDGAGPATRIGFDATRGYGFITANDTGVLPRPLVLQTGGGKVGIGTTNTVEELSLNGDFFLTRDANRTIYVGMEPDNSTEASSLTIWAGSASSSGVPFQARMGGDLILQAGNGFNANVAGKDGGDVIIRSGANWYTGTTDPGGDIVFQTGYITNSFIERMRIIENGNVGIGTTSPSAQFEVQTTKTHPNAGIALVAAGSDPLLRLQNTSAAGRDYAIITAGTGSGIPGAMRFYDSSASLDRMVITSNGNIGVGSTAPNAKLHVVGNQIVSGVVTAAAFVGSGAGLSGITVTNTVITNMVNKTGDTMYGSLSLPANGLTIGTTQLVATAGGIGIGTASVSEGALVVNGLTHHNDYDVLLRSGSDRNHGLGWYGGGKLFANVNVDGPALFGYSGGVLGSAQGSGGTNIALLWNASGNVGIGTTTPTNKLHVAGVVQATAYVTGSDRASKEHIQPVSVQDILAKVAGLPMATWNFKDDKSGRHMGPMAQDFSAAFGLGNTDTGIFTVDADGVALAAIQALNQKMEQKDARLDALQKQNEELRRQLDELRTLVEKVTQQAK